jgi:hypothetical protein
LGVLLVQLTYVRFERIPSELFSHFLDVLYEYRRDFLQEMGHMISQNIRQVLHGKGPGLEYRFENADTTFFLLESMDSWRLVSLCDTNSGSRLMPVPQAGLYRIGMPILTKEDALTAEPSGRDLILDSEEWGCD